MGYKMPIVCKEVYLPLDHSFVYEHDQSTFKIFSEDYKKEYGIDLHDLFDLKLDSNSNEYRVNLKTPYKLFTCSIGDGFDAIKNMVALGVHNARAASITESGNEPLIIIGCGIPNEIGYAFKIEIGPTAPNSIDDLPIEMLEY